MGVILPTKKSGINRDYKSQKIGLIGMSGIGKSDFFAQDPKALFLETEPGLNFLDVFKVQLRDWDDVKSAYSQLAGLPAEGFPYNIVVIDTIDKLVDYATEDVISQANSFYKKEINVISDIPEGAGWYRMRNKIKSFLDHLERLPCAIGYVGHITTKYLETPGVGKYNKDTISIGGKVGEDLLAWTDHTLHVEAIQRGDRLVRTVWTKPTQSREAKSRGGLVPDGWKWTDSSAENYQEFRKLFT